MSPKEERLKELVEYSNFHFLRLDIAGRYAMNSIFEKEQPELVIHLAAQAGVRYFLTNPDAYVDSNLVGFVNILEGSRLVKIKHLVYASSSSAYGGNTKIPFSEEDSVDQLISLYAATKKANELMAYSYSHLYKLPSAGLRFFTVYAPWGRHYMSYFGFTKAILEGRSIDVFNDGQLFRDFTYIDDIVEGVVRVLDKSPSPKSDMEVPHQIFNIGNHEPVALLNFKETLESALGKVAIKKFLPMQPDDIHSTYADMKALDKWVGFKPKTSLGEGI